MGGGLVCGWLARYRDRVGFSAACLGPRALFSAHDATRGIDARYSAPACAGATDARVSKGHARPNRPPPGPRRQLTIMAKNLARADLSAYRMAHSRPGALVMAHSILIPSHP